MEYILSNLLYENKIKSFNKSKNKMYWIDVSQSQYDKISEELKNNQLLMFMIEDEDVFEEFTNSIKDVEKYIDEVFNHDKQIKKMFDNLIWQMLNGRKTEDQINKIFSILTK